MSREGKELERSPDRRVEGKRGLSAWVNTRVIGE